jgi:hypothetical protein
VFFRLILCGQNRVQVCMVSGSPIFSHFGVRQSWRCLCCCDIVSWTLNSFSFTTAKRTTSESSELVANDVYCGRHTLLRQQYVQFSFNLLSLFWKTKRRIITLPCCLCDPPKKNLQLFERSSPKGWVVREQWHAFRLNGMNSFLGGCNVTWPLKS